MMEAVAFSAASRTPCIVRASSSTEASTSNNATCLALSSCSNLRIRNKQRVNSAKGCAGITLANKSNSSILAAMDGKCSLFKQLELGCSRQTFATRLQERNHLRNVIFGTHEVIGPSYSPVTCSHLDMSSLNLPKRVTIGKWGSRRWFTLGAPTLVPNQPRHSRLEFDDQIAPGLNRKSKHGQSMAQNEAFSRSDAHASCSSQESGGQPSQAAWTRRGAISLALAAGASPSLTAASASAEPATSQESPSGNQLLRGLGIGDPDIYYPPVFEGTWDCFSTLVSGEDMSDARSIEFARKQLGFTLEYQARFVPFGGHIVGDRLFTTTALAESTVGKNVVVGGEWTPERPNLLILTLRGGMKVENLVTKRSFDLTGPGRFDSSEYSKQVFDNQRTVNGPPTVKASRNVTRYRWDPKASAVDEIEAFQRVAMFPIVGGSAGDKPAGLTFMDVLTMNMGDKPTTVYKYLVRFRRHKFV
eukprot:jgi/Mesen1/4679/ME000241S03719